MIRHVVIFACLISSFVLPDMAFGQNIPIGSSEPVYCLLKNGNVLHGKLDQSGDKVTVEMDSTAKAVIRASEIEFFGPRLRQLYDFQKNKNLRWDVGEHLHMANWCIRNDLLLEAEEHFLYLRRAIGDQQTFKQLEQQYRQALLNSPEVRSAAGLSNAKSDPQKNTEQPVTTATAEIAFDSMNLSATAVGEFRSAILPMLQMRCGQAACHGEYTKTKLRLFSVSRRSNSSSDRALESSLQYINPDAPQQSKLIQMAISPHGLQTVRGFDPTNQSDRQFLERLQVWIGATKSSQYQNLNNPSNAAKSSNASNAGYFPWQEKMAQMKIMQEVNGQPAVAAGNAGAGNAASDGGVNLSKDDISALEVEIERLEAMERGQVSKTDPFDPAQFNGQLKPSSPPRGQ